MDEIQRYTALKEKIDSLNTEKIRIEERHKNSREKLDKLLKEIAEKGYDPMKLSELKVSLEADLKKSLDELSVKVTEISGKLSTIEAAHA